MDKARRGTYAKGNAAWGLSSYSVAGSRFKRFVACVINQTQMPPVAVSLALLYILRLKSLSKTGIVGSANSEYRVFSVALILANKFLDDNTYTNKTWADVTKLPLRELSAMEIEFLSGMKYRLGVDPDEWSRWQQELKLWLNIHYCAFVTPPSQVQSSRTSARASQPASLTPSPPFQGTASLASAGTAADNGSGLHGRRPAVPLASPSLTPVLQTKRELPSDADAPRPAKMHKCAPSAGPSFDGVYRMAPLQRQAFAQAASVTAPGHYSAPAATQAPASAPAPAPAPAMPTPTAMPMTGHPQMAAIKLVQGNPAWAAGNSPAVNMQAAPVYYYVLKQDKRFTSPQRGLLPSVRPVGPQHVQFELQHYVPQPPLLVPQRSNGYGPQQRFYSPAVVPVAGGFQNARFLSPPLYQLPPVVGPPHQFGSNVQL